MKFLSEHFTLEELTFSEIAIRRGIDNTPNETQIQNLTNLCINVLEPLRLLVNEPIHITSGFRNNLVNSLLGGAINSQHTQGKAVDFHVKGKTIEELYQIVRGSGITLDQAIQEFDSWQHISWSEKNRNEFLRATKVKVNGKTETVYSPDPLS